MALRVEKAHLVAALTQATKAVETRNTVPILANVLLSADASKLTVRATDTDVEITTSVPADGALDTTTAPARTLLDIAKRMPNGAEISLALDGGILTVSHGRSRFKVATLPVEDFPTMTQPAYPVGLAIDLAALLAPVAFAMSTEETRFYLNGVYLHSVHGRLRAVATDGHRLAAVYGPDLDLPEGIIIPRKTVGMIPSGEIEVDIGPGRIRFTAGDTVIVSKLVEGTFPDYERVIPKNNDRPVTLDRALMSAAVERVGVFASERGGKAVKLEVAPGGVTFTVNGEGGQASDELAADYTGEPFDIGYNASYLTEMLRSVEGGKVTFEISDSSSPARIVGANDNWCGVLMPMRV
ncbi:MAG TPA: DNA polymerase III subunit beta [Pelagibacterium sp.]|uniref:DNA polymerase III subunit beta n=1 Tax=Pelagibacterium sp. TaxID=1967288 RepID=UPI002BD9BABA|nr:DNA polymerase III subunit beta [Pelagibacterium sp.]HWJ89059.1 DNA polymerase III subunit beta [Pelagibacterium sp.]